MTDEEKENIKHRVSDIVDQVGKLALEYIADLEEENEELKKDKEWLDNTNNEQTKVILQLNEQIEKMKDYGNCKYGYYSNMCTREDTECCKGCKYWELEE